jgi:hypothetical protein
MKILHFAIAPAMSKPLLKPKLMIEPSYWLEPGIRLEKVGEVQLFKFTAELQARSDELLERSKQTELPAEEQAELDGISQLAQIFTYANSVLVAESAWSPTHFENSLPNAPAFSVNIATPQNL